MGLCVPLPRCSPGTTKLAWKGDKQINTQTDIATTRPNRPSAVGRFGENPFLLVREDKRIKMCGKAFVNGVSQEIPRPKTLGAFGPPLGFWP